MARDRGMNIIEEMAAWPSAYDPATYARIARKVDLAMWHSHKPCIGDPCDLDYECKRHERTSAVVERIYRNEAPHSAG